MKKHKKDKKQNPPGHGVSRRTLIRNAAGAGAALASGIAAPAVLAQVNKPIRLGNISSYTGGLAYSGQANWNALQLYFDSINWTVAGRKIEIIKEDDQFSP
jgi:branched-chain amino acid transport system substrate-binding protein